MNKTALYKGKKFKLKSMKNLFSKQVLIKGIIGIIGIIASHFAASIISKTIVKFVNNKSIDDAVKNSTTFYMLQSAIYWVFMTISIILILSFIGVEGAAVVAILGSLLFAIGLGLQGTLSDMASGIMLIIGNVYKIGDYIEIFDNSGSSFNGTVKEFNIMYTRILDDDSGVIIAVPNRVVYNNIVMNHSSSDKHVVVQVISVSNRNRDLSKALEQLRMNVQRSPLVMETPVVKANISAITNYGTDIEVRYTLRNKDYYVSGTNSVQNQLLTLMRETLIDNNIELVVREISKN
jgi:small conductance mechanosensitive channel